ncbi:complement C1q-like protein 4 [Littorina saxatilis]|uniref:C1q domain-containing protein n=1 Tax=Littorina saxatilis TaxID=31220 RepID=A0AAN9AIA9_9CAEN
MANNGNDWKRSADESNSELQKVIEALKAKVTSLEGEMSQVKSTVAKRQQQVAFTAHFNKGGPTTHSGSYDVPIAFSQVELNLGKGYDSKSGVFTAPVAGLYLFHLYVKGVGTKTANDQFQLAIVNGKSELAKVTLHSELYKYARTSTSVATHVEAGQKVCVKFHNWPVGRSDPFSYDIWHDTSFTGVLICAD